MGKEPGEINLVEEKDRIASLLPERLRAYVNKDHLVHEFFYPVERYPEKIKSLNFDKEPKVKGVLSGIKGQYLLFEDNHVINIRKFGGYLISLQVD